jgi:hypothetical protein
MVGPKSCLPHVTVYVWPSIKIAPATGLVIIGKELVLADAAELLLPWLALPLPVEGGAEMSERASANMTNAEENMVEAQKIKRRWVVSSCG